MLGQLGITKLRPGRNGDANAPNGANYDEAKANPYTALPEVLVTTAGEKVTTSLNVTPVGTCTRDLTSAADNSHLTA